MLTRDPVAERIGSVVVALTRTRRGLVSDELTKADGVPTKSVVNFDNVHTIPHLPPKGDHPVACANGGGVSDVAGCNRLLNPRSATGDDFLVALIG